MADEESFLSAIQLDPDDEPSRLVYGDWLEEEGDLLRAEYIRLEAQLHRIVPRLANLLRTLDPDWLGQVSRKRRLVMTAVSVNKISCIKVVREVTGWGLKEAKDFVEAVLPGKPQVLKDDVDPLEAEELVQKFGELATLRVETMSGVEVPLRIPMRVDDVSIGGGYSLVLLSIPEGSNKIEAVRAVREVNPNLGLKEAVDLVEDVMSGRKARVVVREGLGLGQANRHAKRLEGIAAVAIEQRVVS